jgi:nucleoside-diphosphate-sugar epimerase
MARILALGGSGFIGSYVVRELLGRGHEVCVVDNFSKYGHVAHDFYSHTGFRLVAKDVRGMYPLEFRGYDHILCFAALIGGIKYFHKIPYQIARDNTEILSHAIDCTLAAAKDAVFHYFSSSMVYERVQRPVTEEDALSQPVPITNYGMQKLFGEYLVRGAHVEYGLNFLIVRPFNAVGSGELPTVDSKGEVEFGMAHVIPDFIYKALVRESPFEILGDGEQVRTFTHARDISDAMALMIDRGVKNDDFNICGKNTFSVRELAGKIWGKVNGSLPFPGLRSLPAPPDDVRFRIGVSEKAKRILGWEPKHEIDYIIEDTAGFIRKNMGG